MPTNPTYPGVYIEEIPSGVRTITGVSTSLTAFIGRALRGPTNEASIITSYGDFERTFGGLYVDYPMTYAVRDFFRNGGSQAIIIRLFKGTGGTEKLDLDTLKLEAASPGKWGNRLSVKANTDGITDEVAAQYGLVKADLFNLEVKLLAEDGTTQAIERFNNLSVKNGPRRVDQVLQEESNLVRVQKNPDGTPMLVDPPAIPATGSSADGSDAGDGKDSDPLDDGAYQGSQADKTGLYALEKADLFNLLCIPPDTRGGTTTKTVYDSALQFCADHRAFLIVDSPAAWDKDSTFFSTARDKLGSDLGLNGLKARNGAVYFPRVIEADPLRENKPDTFVPCGIIAGVMARTDAERGVWKAPAGLDASLNGILGLSVNMTDRENGLLNPLGINCLRNFPVVGRVVWGARTLRGADQLADEYKYVPVRRLALYIEESLYRGTQWVVFEPNDEPLWAQIRLNVGAFMNNLFRQGAFQGSTPRDAYFVKCDKETTTQNDINLGIVNIVVGFAPLKPAEFVIIKLQQMTGKIEV